jgi:predicted ester cyclase
MPGNETRAFIQNYFETLLAAGDKAVEKLEEFVADKQLIQHAYFFNAAFPGYQVIPEDIIVEGEKAAVRAIFKGIHKGEFMGIAPTGNAVSVPCMVIYHVVGGKIINNWYSLDRMELLQQLGALS